MFEIVTMMLAAVIAVAAIGYVLTRSGKAFWKFRGKRIVTCPETGEPVGVDVDALHAAATAPFGGEPDLRLKDCSRWPEREPCGQECLAQIEGAPEQCSVRHMLAEWYAGTSCVLCGKAIGEIRWTEHRPGFLTPGREPLVWSEVEPEDLLSVLSTHQRICFNCLVAESFRKDHPDLVIDDPRPSHRAGQ